MPEFQIHFVEKSERGAELFALPDYEDYNRDEYGLYGILARAEKYACIRDYSAVRIWLHQMDYERLLTQVRRQFPNMANSDRMESIGGIPIRVYEERDTAQPGHAMMVVRAHDEEGR